MFPASPSRVTDWDLVATPVLAVMLAALVIFDLRTLRLPDALTLPLIALGLGLGALETGGLPRDSLIGAAAGYGTFWIFGEVFYRLRGVEGLGQGDAKLLGAAGAWLGWGALPAVVLIAAIGGLVVALARGAGGRQIAFGPWLAGAFWVLWLGKLIGWP